MRRLRIAHRRLDRLEDLVLGAVGRAQRAQLPGFEDVEDRDSAWRGPSSPRSAAGSRCRLFGGQLSILSQNPKYSIRRRMHVVSTTSNSSEPVVLERRQPVLNDARL